MVTLRTALTPAPIRSEAEEDFADTAEAYVVSMALDAVQSNAQIVEANDLALRAEAAAIAAVNAPGTTSNSASSLGISGGTKSLVIQTGKTLQEGMWALISATGSPLAWMAGPITSYDAVTGALTVQVVNFSGSGTFTSWKVAVIPPINLVEATAAEIWAGASGVVAFTPRALAAALAPQPVAFASSLVLNGANFWIGTTTITSNCTLQAPTNLTPGQTYTLRCTIGGAGGFNLSAVTPAWEWLGNQPAAIPTAIGAKFELVFRALTATSATLQMRRIN